MFAWKSWLQCVPQPRHSSLKMVPIYTVQFQDNKTNLTNLFSFQINKSREQQSTSYSSPSWTWSFQSNTGNRKFNNNYLVTSLAYVARRYVLLTTSHKCGGRRVVSNVRRLIKVAIVILNSHVNFESRPVHDLECSLVHNATHKLVLLAQPIVERTVNFMASLE